MVLQKMSTESLTIFPLSGCRIDVPKELVCGNCLGIEVKANRFFLHVVECPEERTPHLRLTCSRLADDEDAVTHLQQLLQLHHL